MNSVIFGIRQCGGLISMRWHLMWIRVIYYGSGNSDGYPDSYVVSCQHSMMRVMNQGKPFIGGIYWGRYIYNDLYALLSPSEIIGSMTACGIDGYTCYGMNGLDDGGVMNRMDTHFLDSLRMANEWFSQVICLRKGEKEGDCHFISIRNGTFGAI